MWPPHQRYSNITSLRWTCRHQGKFQKRLFVVILFLSLLFLNRKIEIQFLHSQDFMAAFNLRLDRICGFKMLRTSKPCYVSSSLNEVSQVIHGSFTKEKLIDLYFEVICFINRLHQRISIMSQPIQNPSLHLRLKKLLLVVIR